MRCVYMGKHKRSVVGGLEHLLATGWEVAAVVAPPPDESAAPEQRLDLAARRAGLPLASDDDLYAAIESPHASELDLTAIDTVLSFLFWNRIRKPLIDLADAGCLNFHPAPLPDMRGIGGYNVAILEDWPEWGVSAHFVDETFDTGDVVRVDRFPISRSTFAASNGCSTSSAGPSTRSPPAPRCHARPRATAATSRARSSSRYGPWIPTTRPSSPPAAFAPSGTRPTTAPPST